MGQKFRKKPIVIEAWLFDGSFDSCIEAMKQCPGITWLSANGGSLTIDTLEGQMRADSGDYLIKGIKGEFYPCKPDIFEATYEPVQD